LTSVSSVLVTGAAGFIGSSLVQSLEKSGNNTILALIRKDGSRLPGNASGFCNSGRVQVVSGDLTEPASLNFDSDSRMFDVVFHLAAVTPETRFGNNRLRDVNLAGTKNLFDTVRQRTKHFVYISGVAVFEPSNNADRLINEESPKARQMEYLKTRLAAEDYLRENCAKAGIDFTVVYLPDIVYGNGGNFKRIFLEQISKGKFRIPGSGDYHVNFIHLEDAVNILVTVAKRRSEAANQTYIASDSNPAPFREFVNFTADELGAKHPGSAPLFLAKAVAGSDLIKMLTRDTRASNKKISGLYDFRYPTYRTGIPNVVLQFTTTSRSS
jgi:nucleoside-diphosphate-sugar epimerase